MKKIDYKFLSFLSDLEDCLKNLKYFKENKLKNAEKSMIKHFNILNKKQFKKEN